MGNGTRAHHGMNAVMVCLHFIYYLYLFILFLFWMLTIIIFIWIYNWLCHWWLSPLTLCRAPDKNRYIGYFTLSIVNQLGDLFFLENNCFFTH